MTEFSATTNETPEVLKLESARPEPVVVRPIRPYEVPVACPKPKYEKLPRPGIAVSSPMPASTNRPLKSSSRVYCSSSPMPFR